MDVGSDERNSRSSTFESSKVCLPSTSIISAAQSVPGALNEMSKFSGEISRVFTVRLSERKP